MASWTTPLDCLAQVGEAKRPLLLDLLAKEGIGVEVEGLIFANMSWFTIGMLARVNRMMRDKCRARLLEGGMATMQKGRKGKGWGVIKSRKLTKLEIETGVLDICASYEVLWYMYKVEKYKPQVECVTVFGTGGLLKRALEAEGVTGAHVKACIKFGEPVNMKTFQDIASRFDWDVTCAAMERMGAYHLDQPRVQSAANSAAARAGEIEFLKAQFVKEKKKHMGGVMDAAASGCQPHVLEWGRAKKLRRESCMAESAVKYGTRCKKPVADIIATIEEIEKVETYWHESGIVGLFHRAMAEGAPDVARYIYDRGNSTSKMRMKNCCMGSAVQGGSILCIKYAMELNPDSRVIAYDIDIAAKSDHVEGLRYTNEVVGIEKEELNQAMALALCGSGTFWTGQISTFHESGILYDWNELMIRAAERGKVGVMRFLRSIGASVDARAMIAAIRGNQMSTVKQVHKWGVPWDFEFEKEARGMDMDYYVRELYGLE